MLAVELSAQRNVLVKVVAKIARAPVAPPTAAAKVAARIATGTCQYSTAAYANLLICNQNDNQM